MSDTVGLKADVRELTGSRNTAKLRTQGKLPAVVYGHKREPVSITLDAHEFVENLHHGHRIFEVEVDGGKDTMLVKDLQYDHLGKTVIHADLMRVNLSERVTVQVMLDIRGTAAGTHQGGIVEELMNAVEVECEVRNIPESLLVDIKNLEINEVFHAGQVDLPEGMKLITEPDAVVVSCHEPRVVEVEEEEAVEGLEGLEGVEETAEPEVITEKKEEESAE